MIAVDAMGGDRAPETIVKGAIAAAQKGIPILLCGHRDILIPLLQRVYSRWELLPISVEHASEHIEMDEDPLKSIRIKKDSSIVVAIKAVAQGRAQACISAGNSGAVLVASIIHSGKVNGVERPAIGSFLPTKTGSVFCIDLGGNVDSKADHLFQFGLMGHLFITLFGNKQNPRISLLSNGHEPYKGSEQVKKAYDLFKDSNLNFVGNIEARDIFDDVTDIIVCDGFTGNIMLKAIQGMAHTLLWWVKHEVGQQTWFQRFLFYLTSGIFKSVRSKTDYASVGGALLLGVQHPIVVSHGRSDERAICNGIQFAYQVVQEKRVEIFNAELVQLLKKEQSFTQVVAEKVRSLFRLRNP